MCFKNLIFDNESLISGQLICSNKRSKPFYVAFEI